MKPAWRWAAALVICGLGHGGWAQDMMRHVDLTSPDMVVAEMTRAEVEARLAAATPDVALHRPPMPVLKRRNDLSTPASSSLPAVAIGRPSAEEVARAVPEVQKRREAAPSAGSSGAAARATSLPPADLRLGTSRERLVMSIAPPPAASAPATAGSASSRTSRSRCAPAIGWPCSAAMGWARLPCWRP